MDYAEVAKLATVSFGNSVKLLAQQETSLLENTVMVKSGLKGRSAVAADFVGKFPTEQVTSRLKDTPLNDVLRERRWMEYRMYGGAVPVDKTDEMNTSYDPTDGLVRAAVATYCRDIDAEIIRGIFGANTIGEYREGKKLFPESNILNASAADSNAMIYGLEDALALLKKNQVTVAAEQIFCVVDSYGAKKLRSEGVYISSDYMDNKVLTGSRLTPYAGINFVEYEGCPTNKNSSGKIVHKYPVYCKSGVALGKWQDIFTDITRRTDKSYAWQVYVDYALGATRLEEAKVLSLELTEK